jgi:hypothetical protein
MTEMTRQDAMQFADQFMALQATRNTDEEVELLQRIYGVMSDTENWAKAKDETEMRVHNVGTASPFSQMRERDSNPVETDRQEQAQETIKQSHTLMIATEHMSQGPCLQTSCDQRTGKSGDPPKVVEGYSPKQTAKTPSLEVGHESHREPKLGIEHKVQQVGSGDTSNTPRNYSEDPTSTKIPQNVSAITLARFCTELRVIWRRLEKETFELIADAMASVGLLDKENAKLDEYFRKYSPSSDKAKWQKHFSRDPEQTTEKVFRAHFVWDRDSRKQRVEELWESKERAYETFSWTCAETKKCHQRIDQLEESTTFSERVERAGEFERNFIYIGRC